MAFACTTVMTDGVQRSKVLWLGRIPEKGDWGEFENRRLKVDSPEEGSIESTFKEARGIVFKYNPAKPGTFKRHLEKFVPLATDYGLMIYLIADDETCQSAVNDLLIDLHIKDQIQSIPRINPPSYEIAETFARHNPGPAPNTELKIEGAGDDTSQIFFRRAFSDCDSLIIRPLPGGRSANAYCVNATFENSIAGRFPLPFFAKIDSRQKIKKELACYRDYVSHFIPFHLRPNIEDNRCVEGYDRGMIVGGFVEHPETLLDVARRGHATTAINSLFDETMRGWRIQAKKEAGGLEKEIHETFDPAKIGSTIQQKAAEFGAQRSPEDLCGILTNLPQFDYLAAPIHGDLHVTNVLVHGTNAILIDFAMTRKGLLLSDLASLEVSLEFEISDEDGNEQDWQKSVGDLYLNGSLDRPPNPVEQPCPPEWLLTCIRQIRIRALAERISKSEYKIALALRLLRWSMYEGATDRETSRAAYAYWLAETIILEVCSNVG